MVVIKIAIDGPGKKKPASHWFTSWVAWKNQKISLYLPNFFLVSSFVLPIFKNVNNFERKLLAMGITRKTEKEREREREREGEREKKNFQQHLTSKSLMWIFATDLISLFLSLTCSLSFLLFLSLSVSLSHSCHSLWHALARSQSCSCMLSLLLLLALALCFSPCFTLSFVHSHQQKQRHQ